MHDDNFNVTFSYNCISCLQGFQKYTLIKKACRIYGLMQTVKLNLKLKYM